MFAVLNIFAIMIPLASTESLRAHSPPCPGKKHNGGLMRKMTPTVIWQFCLHLSPGSVGPADDDRVFVKIM